MCFFVWIIYEQVSYLLLLYKNDDKISTYMGKAGVILWRKAIGPGLLEGESLMNQVASCKVLLLFGIGFFNLLKSSFFILY